MRRHGAANAAYRTPGHSANLCASRIPTLAKFSTLIFSFGISFIRLRNAFKHGSNPRKDTGLSYAEFAVLFREGSLLFAAIIGAAYCCAPCIIGAEFEGSPKVGQIWPIK